MLIFKHMEKFVKQKLRNLYNNYSYYGNRESTPTFLLLLLNSLGIISFNKSSCWCDMHNN